MSYAYHREHCRRRTRERLGIKLTRNLRATILADIRSGRATFLNRDCAFETRSVYLVRVGTRTCRVVYCNRLDELITVMGRGRTL